MEDDTNWEVHRPPWVERWTTALNLPADWADPVLARFSEFVNGLSDLVYPDAFIGSDITELDPDLDLFVEAIDTGDVDFLTCTRFFVAYHDALQEHLPSTDDDILALYEQLQRADSKIVPHTTITEFREFCQGTDEKQQLREYVDNIEKTFCYTDSVSPQPGERWLVSPPEMAELVLTVEVLQEVDARAPTPVRSIADPAQRVVVRGIDDRGTTAHGPTPVVGDHLTLQPLSFNYGSKLPDREDR